MSYPQNDAQAIARVQKWAKEESIITETHDDPNARFNFVLRNDGRKGSPLSDNVLIPRIGNPNSLYIRAGATLTAPQRESFRALSPTARNDLMWEIQFSILQYFSVAYDFIPDWQNLESIVFTKPLAYDGLTNDRFLQGVIEVQRAVGLCLLKILKAVGGPVHESPEVFTWKEL